MLKPQATVALKRSQSRTMINISHSTERSAFGEEYSLTPTIHIITRPQWLANQEAEDELSNGESESPFSGQSNTSNHNIIQTNGQMHNSSNNLQPCKKKAQQRVSEQ